LAIGNFTSNIRYGERRRDGGWNDTEILDGGDSGFIAGIVSIQDVLDEVRDHISEERLDRLVLHL
jgi:hypothetical protein